MQPHISLLTVQAELMNCREDAEIYRWAISSIDEVAQRFSVTMTAPKDSQVFVVSVQFDDYPAQPLLIDFIDPATGVTGTKNAYPKSNDSFFHGQRVICHPCSRKSYSGYSGLHADWPLHNWKANAGALTHIPAILDAIYSRISNQYYDGRMV